MSVKKPIPKQDKKTPEMATKGPTLKFLPTVVTSHMARNRLEQMKKSIADVKQMNPTKFFPQKTPIMSPVAKK